MKTGINLRVALIGLFTAALAVLVTAPTPSPSAPNGFLLTGTVKSTSGEPMGGVAVSAKGEGRTITTTVFTDEQGRYYFPPMEPCKYQVWAQADSFETGREQVDLSATRHQDFTLKPLNDYLRQLTGDQLLASLPDETAIDGEVVALDEAGRPSFNALQNYGSSKSPILYYVFDALTIHGRDVTGEPLSSRRELLDLEILPKLGQPIRVSALLDASLPDLIHAVKAQGLEGLVAKRKGSRYESGQRSGAWQKMRVNQGQEFVIGGYTRAPRAFDALVFGYYRDGQLLYVARTRNGFTPASRDQCASGLGVWRRPNARS